jgi:hypothetical protein
MTRSEPTAASAGPDIPAALRSALFDRLLDAWREARERRDAHDGRFELALKAFGVYARARGVPPADMLRALNAVIDPRNGGDSTLDWDDLRQHAGQIAIASYYRDD